MSAHCNGGEGVQTSAKFHDIVQAQTGVEVPVPPSLARLLALPRQEAELDASLDALRAELQRS